MENYESRNQHASLCEDAPPCLWLRLMCIAIPPRYPTLSISIMLNVKQVGHNPKPASIILEALGWSLLSGLSTSVGGMVVSLPWNGPRAEYMHTTHHGLYSYLNTRPTPV